MTSPRSASPRKHNAKQAAVDADVGRRIRAHREERQLSLRELARRLEISPSAISQIETGKSRPSVSTLYAIVSELGMSLDELFGGKNHGRGDRGAQASAAPRGPDEAVEPAGAASSSGRAQPASTRTAIELETGVRWERLTPQADAEADFLYVVYDVGGSSCQCDQFIRHAGREYGLVLSGTLEVNVGFETYVLGPGDSICFDSTDPHRLRNIGTEPVHGVWFVIGRQADRRTLAFEYPSGATAPAPAGAT
jgi:transcriptional regulator with XRE-family HTH domain